MLSSAADCIGVVRCVREKLHVGPPTRSLIVPVGHTGESRSSGPSAQAGRPRRGISLHTHSTASRFRCTLRMPATSRSGRLEAVNWGALVSEQRPREHWRLGAV